MVKMKLKKRRMKKKLITVKKIGVSHIKEVNGSVGQKGSGLKKYCNRRRKRNEEQNILLLTLILS